MNLIKVKVNEEDRITLSSMFDNAIYNARQEIMAYDLVMEHARRFRNERVLG